MVISEAQRALGPHAVARFTIYRVESEFTRKGHWKEEGSTSRAHLTVVLVSLS
jgi:hypothetical protein